LLDDAVLPAEHGTAVGNCVADEPAESFPHQLRADRHARIGPAYAHMTLSDGTVAEETIVYQNDETRCYSTYTFTYLE
jgi:hypothetical protein